MPDPTLDAAIDSLARVKDEHRVILRQIAGDPGMAPETRTSLIDHLYEEEDEHVAEIQGLLTGTSPSAAPAAASAQGMAPRAGLTVGSLRAEPAPIRPVSAAVGGAPASGPGRLSVGSLRP